MDRERQICLRAAAKLKFLACATRLCCSDFEARAASNAIFEGRAREIDEAVMKIERKLREWGDDRLDIQAVDAKQDERRFEFMWDQLSPHIHRLVPELRMPE